MDDLVKRLEHSAWLKNRAGYSGAAEELNEAADAIERLSAEKEALQEQRNALVDKLAKAHTRIAQHEGEAAALKSGQPVEVRGKMWQLVRVEPSEVMLTYVHRQTWLNALSASAQENSHE